MKHTESDLDWLACEVIQQIPGKGPGEPIARGTRILSDAIGTSYDLGGTLEELRQGFPSLSFEQIERLIGFAHQQRNRPRFRLGYPNLHYPKQGGLHLLRTLEDSVGWLDKQPSPQSLLLQSNASVERVLDKTEPR